jgi:hypothetical protein
MALHPGTFEYLKPTDAQLKAMQIARDAFADLAETLATVLPEGPDKTYVLRVLRTAGMWANIAITRQPDGSPRTD